MNVTNRAAIILASGKGKRMESDLPKVLHLVGGKPMVCHVLDAVAGAEVGKMTVIVGHKAEKVVSTLGKDCDIAMQTEQLGTGHAVMMAEEKYKKFDGTIIVLAGDVPLISSKTISNIFSVHEEHGAAVTVLTAFVEEPTGYGRIIRDKRGDLERIVEEKDSTDAEKLVQEINTGTYCFDSKILFGLLKKITNKNAQGEYYITDVISLAKKDGLRVMAVPAIDIDEVRGVNNIEQLVEIEKIFNKKKGK